jgi:hypothetical protein
MKKIKDEDVVAACYTLFIAIATILLIGLIIVQENAKIA